jgi:competence protein ComEA
LTARELTLIPGFGPRRAEAVLRERARGGPFASTADLAARVRGIGPVLAAGLEPFLR